MAKRRFEMYHYRQALVRMRLGDSDRQIAKSGLMGRRVAATVRGEAAARGGTTTANADRGRAGRGVRSVSGG